VYVLAAILMGAISATAHVDPSSNFTGWLGAASAAPLGGLIVALVVGCFVLARTCRDGCSGLLLDFC
jgi:hypothetical protein